MPAEHVASLPCQRTRHVICQAESTCYVRPASLPRRGVDGRSKHRTCCDCPRTELDELFRRATPGEIPDGEADGHGARRAGHRPAGPAAKLAPPRSPGRARSSIREKGELLNEVGPFGLKAVRAKVYKERELARRRRRRSSSTTRTRRSSRTGSATRSARSRPASTSGSSSGSATRSSTSRSSSRQ